MRGSGGGFRDATMGEGIARDDLTDHRLETIAVLGDGFHEPINHDLVVALDLAAQGIGEQLFGEIAGEVVGASGDDGLQFLRRGEMLAAGEFACRVDRATGVVLVAPAADGVEILEAEPDRVEDAVAVRADDSPKSHRPLSLTSSNTIHCANPVSPATLSITPFPLMSFHSRPRTTPGGSGGPTTRS